MFETRAFEGISNLYSPEQFEKIKHSHILIIGLGGVGSWAAEALTRSGVGELSLMDMDEICVSNINRQVHATSKNIGSAKVEMMTKRLFDINPQLTCHQFFDFFDSKTVDILQKYPYSYILDAIDSVENKALLHDMARKLNIPIICIGGSGARKDPSLIKIADLNKSVNDKLLKQLKRRLRRDYSFSKFTQKPFKIPTVFSTEITSQIEEEEHELRNKHSKNCQSGLGSASYVTACFAFFAVSHIIRDLTDDN